MGDDSDTSTLAADFFAAALWDAAKPAMIEVPGYEILDEISRGGMGAVYHARQLRPEREVALKVLLPQFAEEPEMLARFQIEARAMAALDHPGILPVYEVGEADGMPFFSMKLADGGTLAGRLKRGPMAARETAALMIQLTRAVHHAHQHGVLHRDLKPGNFLFMEDGRACVSDFGLAKLSASDHAPLTRTESFFGTPHYMPPEVAAGSVADSTVAGDLYSMGAVFYECLTGKRPHDGRENVAALLRAIADESITPPHAILPALPRDLSVVCMKALERHPRDRYATLAEFADDIERWAEGKPILARPAGALETAWRWACRHPLPAGLLGALAAVLVIGGALLAIALGQTRAQLHRTLIEQARAERLLGKPGHRQRAMDLLRDASAIAKSPDIRDEVAALISRPDLLPHPQKESAARPPDAPPPADAVLHWKSTPHAESWLAWHESGAVRWWQGGKPVAESAPDDGGETEATVSHDGTMAVFTGTANGVVLVMRSGERRVLTNGNDPPVIRFAGFDPTDTRIALAGPDGLNVIAIRGSTGPWSHTGAPARCAAAWSGDGCRLAIAAGDRREALVFSATDGSLCATIPTSGILEHLALDHDGGLLAVASGDGMLTIHDAADGMVFSSVPHRSEGLAFRDQSLLRSLTNDGGAWVWTIGRPFDLFQTWRETPRRKSDGVVSRIAFSPDGGRLLTASAGCVAVWSVDRQCQTGIIPLENQRVDDRTSAWWLGSDAILIQVPGGLERVRVDADGFPGKPERLTRVPGSTVLDVTAGGQWLVSVLNEDGETNRELWPDGDSTKARAHQETIPRTSRGIEVRGNEVRVPAADGTTRRLTVPNAAGIADAAVTPDGSQVIIVNMDHRVMSWRVKTLADTLDAAGF
jgi:hypothetical protein